MRASLLVVALLGGCAWNQQTAAPAVVSRAVAEAPCKVVAPLRPLFPAESLTPDMDIFTKGKTIWADLLARKAYELQLETAIAECSR